MNTLDFDKQHLTPEQVAAYLDRAVTGTEQQNIEAHVAQCMSCRKEMVEVARIGRASPGWRWWYVTLPVAAAAAVILVLVVQRGPPEPIPGTVRGVPSEGIPRFAIVSPVAGGAVSADSVVFVWRSTGQDANYRITVTDPAGSEIWTGAVTDTVVRIPGRVRLGRDERYFWYVDALLPNGQSATTGLHEFRTTP